MTLSDVTFTEGRTISGRKVNVIMGKGGAGSPASSVSSSDKVKTVVVEERGYIEGLQHVVTSESPVKRVSDIVIKPRVSFPLPFDSEILYRGLSVGA